MGIGVQTRDIQEGCVNALPRYLLQLCKMYPLPMFQVIASMWRTTQNGLMTVWSKFVCAGIFAKTELCTFSFEKGSWIQSHSQAIVIKLLESGSNNTANDCMSVELESDEVLQNW